MVRIRFFEKIYLLISEREEGRKGRRKGEGEREGEKSQLVPLIYAFIGCPDRGLNLQPRLFGMTLELTELRSQGRIRFL